MLTRLVVRNSEQVDEVDIELGTSWQLAPASLDPIASMTRWAEPGGAGS